MWFYFLAGETAKAQTHTEPLKMVMITCGLNKYFLVITSIYIMSGRSFLPH